MQEKQRLEASRRELRGDKMAEKLEVFYVHLRNFKTFGHLQSLQNCTNCEKIHNVSGSTLGMNVLTCTTSSIEVLDISVSFKEAQRMYPPAQRKHRSFPKVQ